MYHHNTCPDSPLCSYYFCNRHKKHENCARSYHFWFVYSTFSVLFLQWSLILHCIKLWQIYIFNLTRGMDYDKLCQQQRKIGPTKNCANKIVHWIIDYFEKLGFLQSISACDYFYATELLPNVLQTFCIIS